MKHSIYLRDGGDKGYYFTLFKENSIHAMCDVRKFKRLDKGVEYTLW